MLGAKLRPKWSQHGSQVPLQEQVVQNTKTFKNSVGSFKNEASRLATWQQQGCEKAKKQYQEAMTFEMDFVIGFGAVDLGGQLGSKHAPEINANWCWKMGACGRRFPGATWGG